MQPPPPPTPGFQRSDWLDAVELLGGQRAAARKLGIAERTMRALMSGERKIHDGFLADMSKALLDHAEACRRAERKLTPAFAANLTVDQFTKRRGASGAAAQRLAEFRTVEEPRALEIWRAERSPGVKRQMEAIFNRRFNKVDPHG